LNFDLKCDNYTKNILINGFITALIFSSFIYLEYFNLSNKTLNTLTIIISYYLFIKLDRKSMFFTGFFIGLLWFYWIAYSFIYYELVYLIPIILLGIAGIYGFIFYIVAYYKNIFLRIILLFALTFFAPFGFNWFKLDLPLINTYFYTYESNIKPSKLKIYLPKYDISQEKKWDKSYRQTLIKKNLNNIDTAIKNNYDIVVLPETIFPFDLNQNTRLKNTLLEKSNEIAIVTGAISSKDGLNYNSTYMFNNHKLTIANKVVLVPFGESIPAPKFIRDIINDIFFNGASDYQVAKKPTTFVIKGEKFRNAICYEATSDEIYKNLDTSYIFVTSNNAWFTPSIEPSLQKLLLEYYAKKYNVIIYHSTNKSKNMIIQ
jgi:apolipoprotein N-acyltransferase